MRAYPRTPAVSDYRYQAPRAENDRWKMGNAQSVGIDENRLTDLIRRIGAADPWNDSSNLIHSVVVARHGKLILEEYFFGFARERPHDLPSASKPSASVLLGISMDHGARLSPGSPIYPLVGGDDHFANPDPNKRSVTLADLMTHSSGLACDDNDAGSPGNESTMLGRSAFDWCTYTQNLPLVNQPGSRWAYCSAGINLIGAALHDATGKWLSEYFDRYRARPLQFGRYYINLMPDTEAYLGGGMYLRLRNFLKVGQAYLDGGRWNGRQIVSERWVSQSTAPGISGFDGDREGYAWHVYRITARDHAYSEV